MDIYRGMHFLYHTFNAVNSGFPSAIDCFYSQLVALSSLRRRCHQHTVGSCWQAALWRTRGFFRSWTDDFVKWLKIWVNSVIMSVKLGWWILLRRVLVLLRSKWLKQQQKSRTHLRTKLQWHSQLPFVLAPENRTFRIPGWLVASNICAERRGIVSFPHSVWMTLLYWAKWVVRPPIVRSRPVWKLFDDVCSRMIMFANSYSLQQK